MKNLLFPAGLVLGLTLVLTGCETDGGIASRTREKSASYATLKVWQKRLIDEGAIAEGFSADMVYMALGRPNQVELKEIPGGRAELWTYRQYYPQIDAVHGFRFQEFTTESTYQPQRSTVGRGGVPVGMDMGMGQSIFATGPPQGGTMEPATLRSYTIYVLLAGGKVARISATQNDN